MKFSKPWAFLFVMGLLIHTIVVPSAPITAASSITPRETPASSRVGLPSVSQESESIDSFNVHPENRWSEGTSGTFAEDLENGEFSIQAFDNSSSSNLRFRDAETTSGDIETRWRLNATDSDAINDSGSDFETILMGLNVTTDEGSGNSSLNAYYWNSTHYVVRPTFTTSDGSSWRSWNIESDFQDWFQTNGKSGADGLDFIEGDEGFTESFPGRGAITAAKGVLNYTITVNTQASAGLDFPNTDFLPLSSTGDFSWWIIKIRANEANLRFHILLQNTVPARSQFVPQQNQVLTTEWQTFIAQVDNTYADNAFIQVLEEDGQGNFDIGEQFLIEYVLLTTENVTTTDDLTFFEYETYYRGQMKYDLMESTLNWKISDDSDNKITSTVQGSFKIEAFFDTDELIRDISLGTVGDLDYFFGLRSAGANATIWWDFYQADFQEFLWDSTSVLENNDVWDSKTPYAAYYKANAHTTLLWAKYRLTVPEFDSASGTFAIQETNADITICALQLTVYSVTAETGALVEELQIEQGDDVGGATPGSTHNLTISIDAAAQTTFQADAGTLDSSETAFSILFDKVNRSLSLQMSYQNGTGDSLGLAYAATVASGQSNEFVFDLIYFTGASPAAATGEEVHFQLKQWDLTFRDLFGGIPNPLDVIDDVTGTVIPKDPIGFLIQAFRDLSSIAGDSLAVSGQILTNIINIAGSLVIIAANSILMSAGIASLVLDTAQILLDLDSLITNTGGLVADFTQMLADMASLLADTTALLADFTALLADTTTMITHLGDVATGVADLPADFISLLADTAGLLTTAGEIFDELVNALGDSWLGEIFDVLFALVTDLVLEIVAEALAIMTSVLDAMISYFRAITVAGVSIGDLIDFLDAWLVNFWTVADSLISLGTEILTVWTQVFLMGLLGIILIWAAASANGDGALFTERFTTAMNYDINPVSFVLSIRIPLGAILLGNLFWIVFTAYDWEGFLIPAVVIASFQLGSTYETPDYSDQMDDFFEYTSGVLESILDTLLDEIAGTFWKTLVTLLSDDILGASPEVIVFVVTAGIAATILIRGRF